MNKNDFSFARRATLLGSAALLIALSHPVIAQTAGDTSAPGASNDDGALAEIVVTAQKRSENLQDVPIAVTAVNAERLANARIENLTELRAVAPGLNMRTSFNNFNPYIRGVGTESGFTENPVGIYIDGVYIAQQRDGIQNMNDIAQVAVLKGPQGTLFGRNTTGGVIQITTRGPSYDAGGEAGLSYDEYQTLTSDLYLTGGLSDKVAASISTQYRTQGKGWGDNLTTGNDTFKTKHNFSIRGKLMFEPGDNTTITLIGDYRDSHDLAEAYQPYPGTVPTIAWTGPGGYVPVDSRYDTRAGRDSFIKIKTGGASLNIDHDLGFARLVSISAYRAGNTKLIGDTDGLPGTLSELRFPDTPSDVYTQEIQLVSNDSSSFNWMAGAFYINNTNVVERTIVVGPFALYARNKEVAESIAPFAQATLEVLPGTKLTGGIRYTYEKRDLTSKDLAGVETDFGSKTFKEITYRIALDHQINDNVLAYASHSRGFKSGGFNAIVQTNPAFAPESLHAYEAGLKTELLDRSARFNIAGFYYDFANVQVNRYVSGFPILQNGGGAELYGVDIDLDAKLAEGLTFSGGLEWLSAKYSNYPNAGRATFNPFPPGGATIDTTFNAKGKRLPLSQEFVANGTLTYEHEMMGAKVSYSGTVNYSSEFFFEPDNVVRQKPYFMVNGSVRVLLPGDKISLTVFVKNLLDEAILNRAYARADAALANYGSPPRTFGVAARYSF
ncbi:TonB-dependent receptor [Rhizorhabdus dicambivorans]|uniref:TonB-dependent receptor n=1 Tax=Rhizorhabdus dicambivorans TaxID=1850238 RepID=A0A2A4FR29_9SPHN|nr:TonB-dependent receptor [Rhizorhabdus dicambivorans]ATE65480.1 TonB-dependent receptor [Rhizorhabdus dicambivorans]PCE39861.1 TonB-dependent receptor [Rhizorhabdus dicambivorans]